jgi:hypothetical protein
MNPTTIIGVISDTHGLLRPEALRALQGSNLILHAGDVGSATILPALAEIAPLTAVRGNVDVNEPWANGLPANAVAEVGDTMIYILHNIGELDLRPEAAGFRAVIFGHSHQPTEKWRNGVLYFNPGSAGPRRFRLPICVGRLSRRRHDPARVDQLVVWVPCFSRRERVRIPDNFGCPTLFAKRKGGDFPIVLGALPFSRSERVGGRRTTRSPYRLR